MDKYKTSSIGYELFVPIHKCNTEETYNSLAGPRSNGLSAVLDDAIGALIAWDWLPSWQDKFAAKLEQLFPATHATPFIREINVKATEAAVAAAKSPEAKAKAKVYETITKSVRRFRASLTPEADAESAVLAQEIADSLPADPSPSQRSGKIKADLTIKADGWLLLTADELEAKIELLRTKVPNYELISEDDGKPNRDSLARMIGAYLDVKAAEAAAELAGV